MCGTEWNVSQNAIKWQELHSKCTGLHIRLTKTTKTTPIICTQPRTNRRTGSGRPSVQRVFQTICTILPVKMPSVPTSFCDKPLKRGHSPKLRDSSLQFHSHSAVVPGTRKCRSHRGAKCNMTPPPHGIQRLKKKESK